MTLAGNFVFNLHPVSGLHMGTVALLTMAQIGTNTKYISYSSGEFLKNIGLFMALTVCTEKHSESTQNVSKIHSTHSIFIFPKHNAYIWIFHLSNNSPLTNV